MWTCRTCGERNPDRSRFCGACGTRFEGASSAPNEERKFVSILFVDIVEFTSRAHEADPEDVRAALSLYYARLRKEIERFGGRVEKFIGDAVVGIFGAPVAHEDDPERAVRAGLRITEAIKEMNEADPSLNLTARGAVETGQVVVALGTKDKAQEAIVGDVVNTTARLQSAAPPGAVVVGEVAYNATNTFIEYEPLPSVMVKGKPAPLALWRAVAARSRYGVEVQPSTDASFVGRAHELSILKNAFASTLEYRTAHCVTISGEPGAGKSRLVYEFFTYVDDQEEVVFWRQGRSLPYGDGISLWGLTGVVKAHAGILESDSADEALEKLRIAVAATVDDPNERDWFETQLAPLVGASGAQNAEGNTAESFAAWSRFFAAVALRRPLVLVFEDLHWAGETLLDFVEHVVDWCSDVPVLVICTSRPELYERRPRWGGGMQNAHSITLQPLSDEETGRLIKELLGDVELPGDLLPRLVDQAEGNPLYAEEFARMLHDRSSLAASDGSHSPAVLELPSSIHAVIAARLDTLPGELKSLLQDASVIGRSFWPDALERLGGREGTVEAALHELARREFVRAGKSTSISGQREYAFRHALIRDVTYGQIPRAARAHKHRAVAEWIEGIAGRRIEDHAELLAYHYDRALELTRAAGLQGDEDGLQALARRYLMLAGERALQLDIDKAISYFRRTVDLVADDPVSQLAARAQLVEASLIAGDIESVEAERILTSCVAELLKLNERRRAGEVMTKLSRVQWQHGGRSAARASLSQAIELLEQEEPSSELVYAYAQTAGEEWASGRTRECLVWAEKAIDLGDRLGVKDQAIRARGFRGAARCDLGDSGGLEEVENALELAQGEGLGRETSVQFNNVGYLRWLMRGPAAAVETYRRGIAFGEHRGLLLEAQWMKVSLGEALYDLGHWDELLAVSDEAMEWATRHGVEDLGLAAGVHRLQVELRREDVEAPGSATEELLEKARRAADPQQLVGSLTLAICIARAGGGPTTALTEELRDYVQRDESFEWLRHLPDVARALSVEGELDSFVTVVERIKTPYWRHALSLETAGAVVLASRGDPDEALDAFDRAASGWRDYGCPLEVAEARVGAARCLISTGRATEAQERLREAASIAETLEARAFRRETLALERT